MNPRAALILCAGGSLGVLARVLLGTAVSRRWGLAFPWGTAAVNTAGCFLIGLFWVWAEERVRLGPAARLFLMAGFCGGFTTFSTYALDTAQLLRAGSALAAAGYAAGSAALGLGAFYAGAALGRA